MIFAIQHSRARRPPRATHPGERIFAAGLIAVCLLLCGLSPIDGYKSGDPRGSLMVSQAILRHGTVALDPYPEEVLKEMTWQKFRRSGHLFYGYPLGTSFFVLPFVGLADLLHMDMEKSHHAIRLQGYLAALTSAAAILLILLLARCFLPPAAAAAAALLLGFGGPVVSTMGVALFNINLTVVFLLASLLLLARDRLGRRPLNPYLLGFCLFGAFICRPTSAVLIACVLGYLLIERRPAFFRTAAAALVFLAGHTLFSYAVYGTFYPGFYNFRGGGLAVFRWRALFGNLLSPSRGLLVFSPFLLVVMIGVIAYFGRLRRDRLLLSMLAAFVLHLLLVSRWIVWWGGGSFGPRMLADGYPALVLISLLVFREISRSGRIAPRRAAVFSLAVLGAASIAIHSGSGLFNPCAEEWNYILPAKNADAMIFDWRHPQFLAGPGTMAGRMARFGGSILEGSVDLGEVVGPGRPEALFYHWGHIEKEGTARFRWSLGTSSQIWMKVQCGGRLTPDKRLSLWVRAGTYGPQTIAVHLNRKRLGIIRAEDSFVNIRPSRFRFDFKASDLGPMDEDGCCLAGIEFHIPQAVSPRRLDPSSPDKRRLGLYLHSLKLAEAKRGAERRPNASASD